jgi:glycosyltransferase involved in cell wall biosynthesis
MKIAVVHDYFTQIGGAEKVAEQMYHMLPHATLFATVALEQFMPRSLKDVPVVTSWMQKLPNIESYYRLYFLLYPFAIRDLDLSQFDLVLSSSSGCSKGVQTGRDAMHVCYCHTPMRWAWNYDGVSSNDTFGASQRGLLPVLLRGLRHWDEDASRQPDHFVANSIAVAERIRRAYGRSAEVIHPPIDVNRFRPADEQENYYLILARLFSYKRIDLAIEACTQSGKHLLVIGDGPDRGRLEALAGPTVRFLGHLSDLEVSYYAARCKALLFTGEQDFVIAPLEVAAAGRPTIAYRAGGATETIIENVTGVFFNEQTPEHLAQAIDRFERQDWIPTVMRRHAQKFSVDVFRDRFRSFLKRVGAPVDIKSSKAVEPFLVKTAS